MKKIHLFIINPRSFWHAWKRNEVLERIHRYFNYTNNKNYEIHVSRFPRDAVGFIPEYAKKLPEGTTLRVYAVGGDGILFDCLNGIMGLRDVELGAIPYGHTNNFTRGFGKEENAFFRNISRQINAPTMPLDVMRCGDNYALEYCAVGLVAEAVRYADRTRSKLEKQKAFSQWLSRRMYIPHYFFGGFSASLDKRLLHQHYDLDVDGEKFDDYFWAISMHNSPYYGGNWHPSNTAIPTDGLMDVLLVRGKRFLQTYSLFPLYMAGHHKILSRNITFRQVRKVSIRSEDTIMICMDDIVFYENEFDIELLPAAINFIDASRYGYLGVSND